MGTGRKIIHGHAKRNGETATYGTWRYMMSRCYNPNDWGYHNYGARHIRVCWRWHTFKNFLEDMGPKPSPELTLDRINNDKGYTPKNCRWISRREQRLNQRPRSEWSKEN